MSLLWRRGAIASLIALGLVAFLAAAFLFAGRLHASPSLAFSWLSCGVVLCVAAPLLFDGRKFSHALIFSTIAVLVALSLTEASPPVWFYSAPVFALSACVCTAVAWITRERQPDPTLADYYDAAVKARRIRDNAAQREIVDTLDDLRTAFRRYERRRRMPWAFLLKPPPGVYLHGPAGQGKSFLLDGMFDTTPSRAKHRYHFHDLVAELSDAAHEHANFRRAAKGMVDRASLVMIDEVNVLDPATALMYVRLMHIWWRMGCVVCISSNQSPQQLFKGIAVPAKELELFFASLEKNTQVDRLDVGEDYRLQKLGAQDLYQYPITEATEQRTKAIVELLAESPLENTPIQINGRQFSNRLHAAGVAWFDFKELCETAMSYRDYLSLVEMFPNLVVSNVPRMLDEDPARRFAWLVEIFYDRRKRLILSAQVPINELFAPELSSRGTDMDFVKIQSRLIEMQSSEYDYTLV